MAITYTAETFNTETCKYDRSTKTIAVGCTLDTWAGSIQIFFDEWASTTYASYWDEESQQVKQICEISSVTVDATPEVLEKVRAFYFNRYLQNAINDAQNEAARIVKGSAVEVVSGRTAKGTKGPVVVIIERPYGMGYRASLEKKLAIATSDRKVKVPARNGKVYENYADVVWVWARNCELTEVPAIDMDECNERAKNRADAEIGSLLRKAAQRTRKVAA
jgi:hypothetical protein